MRFFLFAITNLLHPEEHADGVRLEGRTPVVQDYRAVRADGRETGFAATDGRCNVAPEPGGVQGIRE
jgi:hypothetical protein